MSLSIPPAFSPPPVDPSLEALHILQRLGEGGLPPEHGVLRINVGNESYLRVLEDEYFQRQLRIGSSFKLVQGYFGAGKTHFLYCVRELAWRQGFVTAVVELSPTECPYDDAFKVYQSVARRLALPPRQAMAQPDYGVGDVLRSHLDDRLAQARDQLAQAGAAKPEEAARQAALEWLDGTVGRAPCESHSYRQAIVALGRAYLEGDRAAERVLEAWLLGEPVPPGELRPHGVYEALSKANGFTMLRALTQMSVALGFAGTALLFDEVDRNLSVSAKRSHAIGDNLRQVIDLCGRHQLPNTLFMYAVPPEFMRNVVPDYPALYQRLQSPIPLSVRSPQAVLIDLERLDLEPEELLTRLGARVVEVFEAARGVQLDHARQEANARTLAKAAVASFFEVNHRRLFVKTWVDFLQGQLVDGETGLTAAEAERLVNLSHAGLAAASSEAAGEGDDFDDF